MRSRFGKKKQQSEEMALQITSMADIFTIILVFLLKSYSTGAVGATPGEGVTLPVARDGLASVETLKIEIAPSGVQVDGRKAVELNAFQFESSDLEPGGASRTLLGAFAEERGKGKDSEKPDPRLTVLADQRTPYLTLKTVLASASSHGYTDFKLVVVNPEE